MKKIITVFLLAILAAGFNQVKSFSQSTTPMVFDQLSTQFVTIGQTVTIPVGVTALNSASQVSILSVSGLPGAVVQSVTSLGTLGPRAAFNLTWKPSVTGTYTCQVTAQDKVSGNVVTANFNFNVSPIPYNQTVSPSISTLGVQEVAPGGILNVSVNASRPFAPQNVSPVANLFLQASGLPGLILSNVSDSPLNVSGIVSWQAPMTQGVYYLNIVVSDPYGAYTTQQVPVAVSTGASNFAPLVFDQLSTQFLTSAQTVTIPIGVTSLNPTSQVSILSVSGLPGVTVQSVTSLGTLGPRAAFNLTWTPIVAGIYTCQVTAQDKVSGNVVTANFLFNVTLNPLGSVSPSISALGVQEVAPGGILNVSVNASRPFAPQNVSPVPNLYLQASGLSGLTLSNVSDSPMNVSGIVSWQAPMVQGIYYLNIAVADLYGAYTVQQVPVAVSTGASNFAPLVFDQLSTQFLTTGQNVTIPIGVTSLGNASQVSILSVSGLPGATVQSVTSLGTLGPRAAFNLTWKPTLSGIYTCQVTAQDKVSGNVVTANFLFNVTSNPLGSVSPSISALGLQEVAPGGILNVSVNASRPFAPQNVSPVPNLYLQASGLSGLTLSNVSDSPMNVSGIVSWQAPMVQGIYYLNIAVADLYGAYTVQQVPVAVSTGASNFAPLVFDQLSTQFLTTGQSVTIPVGVTSLASTSQVTILSVSGLPGATAQSVTSLGTLGPRAAFNLTWTPAVTGLYTCQVTAQDKVSGNVITANFLFNVTLNPLGSVSPSISALGVQEVAPGGILNVSVNASRPNSPQNVLTVANLYLQASGLYGLTLSNVSYSSMNVSGIVSWQAPMVQGIYYLNIAVADPYGAYTFVQVPVIVGVSPWNPPPTMSQDGSVLCVANSSLNLCPGTSLTSLLNSSGKWTYDTAVASPNNNFILLNGARAGGGYGALLLLYKGQIYAYNSVGSWWQWNGSGWNGVTHDPRWINLTGVSITSTTFTKTAATGWGNGGAVFDRQITTSGSVSLQSSTVPGNSNSVVMAGFVTAGSNFTNTYTGFNYSIVLKYNQQEIYEGPTCVQVIKGNYNPTDTYSVSRSGSMISYMKNNTTIYISSTQATVPLVAATAQYDNGGTITSAVVTGY